MSVPQKNVKDLPRKVYLFLITPIHYKHIALEERASTSGLTKNLSDKKSMRYILGKEIPP